MREDAESSANMGSPWGALGRSRGEPRWITVITATASPTASLYTIRETHIQLGVSSFSEFLRLVEQSARNDPLNWNPINLIREKLLKQTQETFSWLQFSGRQVPTSLLPYPWPMSILTEYRVCFARNRQLTDCKKGGFTYCLFRSSFSRMIQTMVVLRLLSIRPLTMISGAPGFSYRRSSDRCGERTRENPQILSIRLSIRGRVGELQLAEMVQSDSHDERRHRLTSNIEPQT